MTEKPRYPLKEAEAVAEQLKLLLAPACERIEIAGSIRRQRPDVGDIELLAIPKPTDLLWFNDELDRQIKGFLGEHLDYRPNINGSRIYGPKNKLLVHRLSSIPVDIFSTDKKNWGMAYMIRTGPASWNIAMMTRFKECRMSGHAYGGITSASGQEINCPDEETVFRLLGWPWIPPEERM